jgi:small subunit ribosomal protein S11
MAKSTSKKRKVIVDASGEAHIHASFNNIIISITNLKGEVISWSSAGKMGFKGSKKNTPFAAQTAAEDAAKTAHDAGVKRIKVLVKGPGHGRESAIRTLHNNGLEVTEIIDVTPTPHNGCRPPKRRRV